MRRLTTSVLILNLRFQSTHPRGVRLDSEFCATSPIYFNPRTHVGCDRKREDLRKWYIISIHAPTWGATSLPSRPRTCLTNFNPRTHVGCDSSSIISDFSKHYFNPRTHVGCDFGDVPESLRKLIFQSTHPRGVRPSHGSVALHTYYFNPRTHVGCDALQERIQQDFIDFNPRTHVGCDGNLKVMTFAIITFQSTHPRGVRLLVAVRLRPLSHFNPRTHVGCDLLSPRL